MQIVFPKLEEWQKDVYDEMADCYQTGKVFVVKSKRQVGKSCLAALELIEFGLKYKCISVVVEPTQAQSRRLFKQIVDMMAKTKLVKIANSTLLIIEFTNGSEILFKSAEQEDALRGFTVSGLLVIDEAAFIKKDIFELLYATTDANNAPILVISTPLFCSGEFYELYNRGLSGNERIKSFNWSTYDTSKFLSKEKLEYYRQTISPLKFKSEYLGEFIAEGSYLFGDINKNVKNWSNKKPKYAGIDWGAGNGGDFTVVVLMDDDGWIVDILTMKDISPVEQVERIAEIINKNPTLKTITVEMNSIGRIYYDSLRRKININNCMIRQFTTTNESKRDIVEQLIEGFQTGEITIPYDEELIRELQHYTIEKTSKGYTYNGADGVHDDYVIALCLAYDTLKKRLGSFNFSFA